MPNDLTADADEVGTTAPNPASDAPPANRQAVVPADTGGMDIDAPASDDGAADAASSPWPTRPENVKTDAEIADWKAEVGLPDRDAYDLPDLGEGRQFTGYGEQLATEILEIGYGLDLPPAAAQQLVARGAEAIERLRIERDGADKAAATADMVEEMGNEGAKDQVAAGRAYLKSLGEFGKVLSQARGPDGRRLSYDPEFWAWASALHDTGASADTPRTSAAATRDEASLRKELSSINALMQSDRDAYATRPWRDSGMTASDRSVQLRALLARRAAGERGPTEAERKAALQKEVEELQRLERTDPERYEYAPVRNSKLTGAERFNQIARAGR